MSRSYVPDKWVIVKISSKEHGDIYKILAGWYGGFAGANSWKLSSGITSVELDDEGTAHYHQSSGSTYICDPGAIGFTGMTSNMFAHWEKQLVSSGTIEVMPHDFDVSEVCNE